MNDLVDFIKKLLFKNLPFKLLSIVIGFSVWLYCMTIIDPVVQENISVNLQLRNIAKLSQNNIVLVNQSDLEHRKITLTVRGSSSQIKGAAANPSSVVGAYIDFGILDFIYNSKLEAQIPAPVKLDLASGRLEIVKAPDDVSVMFDRIVEIDKIVTTVMNGAAAESYIASKAEVSPDTIKITGPSMTLENVFSVRVESNIDGADDTVTAKSAVKLYDRNGNDITETQGIQIEPTSVLVSVPIRKMIRVPINPIITGEPAEGYKYLGFEQSLASLELVGKREELEKISRFDVKINISGISETKVSEHDLRMELISKNISDVEIINGSPYELEVSVRIDKIEEREIEVVIEPSENPENPEYAFVSKDSLTVRIQAISAVMADVRPEDVFGRIDIGGLSPGEHDLPVKFMLPPGVIIVYEKDKDGASVIPTVKVRIPEPEQ